MNSQAHRQQAANHAAAALARHDAATRLATTNPAAARAHEQEAARHEAAAETHEAAAAQLSRNQKRQAYGDAISNRF